MTPLPKLMAAADVCRGQRTEMLRMLAKPCVHCTRRLAQLDDHEDSADYIEPAAEWSETTNKWRCGNRLPVEG